jgi:hypothetical protein
MSTVLEFAEGPLFRIGWLFLILGFLRLVLLGARPARLRPGHFVHRIASLVAMAGLIVLAVFHNGHLALWSSEGMPALTHSVSDVVLWFAIVSVVVLLVIRSRHALVRPARRRVELAAIVLMGIVFLTGWFTTHASISPLPWGVARLAHVLAADVLLIVIPFTRLSHLEWAPADGKEVAREGHPA